MTKKTNAALAALKKKELLQWRAHTAQYARDVNVYLRKLQTAPIGALNLFLISSSSSLDPRGGYIQILPSGPPSPPHKANVNISVQVIGNGDVQSIGNVVQEAL